MIDGGTYVGLLPKLPMIQPLADLGDPWEAVLTALERQLRERRER